MKNSNQNIILMCFVLGLCHVPMIQSMVRLRQMSKIVGMQLRSITMSPGQAYKFMGLSETATREEIKNRYRELAKKYHPDQGGTDEQFKNLGAAYEAIKDGPRSQQSSGDQTSTSGNRSSYYTYEEPSRNHEEEFKKYQQAAQERERRSSEERWKRWAEFSAKQKKEEEHRRAKYSSYGSDQKDSTSEKNTYTDNTKKTTFTSKNYYDPYTRTTHYNYAVNISIKRLLGIFGGIFAWKYYQRRPVTIYMEKGWFGAAPSQNEIWKEIQKTHPKISEKTHRYTYSDNDNNWKIVFKKK